MVRRIAVPTGRVPVIQWIGLVRYRETFVQEWSGNADHRREQMGGLMAVRGPDGVQRALPRIGIRVPAAPGQKLLLAFVGELVEVDLPAILHIEMCRHPVVERFHRCGIDVIAGRVVIDVVGGGLCNRRQLLQ